MISDLQLRRIHIYKSCIGNKYLRHPSIERQDGNPQLGRKQTYLSLKPTRLGMVHNSRCCLGISQCSYILVSLVRIECYLHGVHVLVNKSGIGNNWYGHLCIHCIHYMMVEEHTSIYLLKQRILLRITHMSVKPRSTVQYNGNHVPR